MHAPGSFPPRRRVRLWFGPHQIAEYIGDPPAATRYEAAMRRRFPGLDTTNDPVSIAPSPGVRR
ncbi:hypothetical protein [Kribbella kalugense]|uniref:Uncharacterized protein n=1 Tax=Kribbella kalugense TaxID=2512221 RepID=A0A4R7ZH15_9ACTN|nr:hypothetical protein [Kribbella kalugense]TDW16969.1 hypothetical protein EV650_3530 [Kribbella kalugense]